MVLLDSRILHKNFFTFFDEFKRNEIREIISEEKKYIKIDFFEILKFNLELAEQLLQNPEEILKIMENSVNEFREDKDLLRKIKIRLISLPDSEKILIRNIRSIHIGKLVLVEGIVRRKTDVRPRLKYIEFLCTNPTCNYSEEKFKVFQNENKIKIIKSCPKCKSQTEIVNKYLVDSQSLILEEIPEKLENTADQPKRMTILLQDDLVSPFKDSKTNPGSRVYVIGIVKEIPIQTRTGSDSVNYEILIKGEHINLIEEDYSDIIISKKEIKEIKELSKKDNVVDILIDSIAPSIYGHKKIKEAILLQTFGGVGSLRPDGIKIRGDIHILLIGDPGVAKSQLLKSSSKIAPKSMFVSGKSATGVGLTATVIKDELTKGWALEAGALVLANGGLCAIDELDKMSEDDTSAMHEALEQQTISIAKANIRATLKCETSVLGAANPKFGRFDPYGDIGKQINFPPPLLSRFDLIFALRDIPNKKKDSLIATHILQTHKEKIKNNPKLSSTFLKKYITYAKKEISPVLTDEAIETIKDFYVQIRTVSNLEDENAIKSVPISARQLEAIIRLSEAYAKLKFDPLVKVEYAKKAIELLMYCLEKIGIDPKTGNMDIDRLTTGVMASTRNQYKIVQQILDKLEIENPDIKYEDIISNSIKQNISKTEVQKILEKLKNEGMIYEPRKNLYKKLL